MKYQRLVCPEHNVIQLVDYELSASLASDQILVRNTHGAEKHGTMEAFIRKFGNRRGAWNKPRLMHTPGEGLGWAYPIPLGNMQVGFVEKTGSAVSRYRPGDRLVYFHGFEPFSVVAETEGWPIAPDTNWKSATLIDPASFAYTALRDSGTRLGDAIAIFGLGAIGLTAVALARMAGCHPIFAIDPVEKRRRIAAALGADVTLDPVGLDVGAKLRELTNWRGVDVATTIPGRSPRSMPPCAASLSAARSPAERFRRRMAPAWTSEARRI
jgi:D-arabinose 1-dehydrogenase-like Zn-dependent alcohol dehydrogenase